MPNLSHRTAISAVFFMFGAFMASWAVMVPLIRLKLDLNEAELSQLILMIGFGSLLGMFVAGRLLRTQPNADVTRWFGICAFPMLAFLGFAPSVWVAALAIFAMGLCGSVTDIAMNGNGVDVEDDLGKPVLSSFHGWFSAGGLTAIPLGWLAARLGLEAMAVMAAASLSLAFWLVQRFMLQRGVEPIENSARKKKWWVSLPGILLILAAANFVAYSLEGAVVDWSGVYLQKDLGASPELFGLGFACFSITMAGMRFSGDYLRERFGSRNLALASFLVSTLAYCAVASAQSVWFATLGYTLLGAGMANLVPVLFVMAARVPGLAPGMGIAAVAGIGAVGFLAMPPLIGFVAHVTSLSTAFFGLAAILLLSSFSVLVFPPTTARKD